MAEQELVKSDSERDCICGNIIQLKHFDVYLTAAKKKPKGQNARKPRVSYNENNRPNQQLIL